MRKMTWRGWVAGRTAIGSRQKELALKIIANYLKNAPPTFIIPWMTRRRAAPEVFRVVHVYRQHGMHSDDVDAFFLTAPREVREAFDEIRRAAT
ncbi:hypothetical protein [Palleronia sp.]|uniref:hypothetical protein n=1 Tax=Palleronia sp. TaxID=1940284 RepID=UPI0035C7DAD4